MIKKFDVMEIEDRLNWLRTYNDILAHTQASIDEGYFNDKPSAGCVIMNDYIEKSGELLVDILKMIFGDQYNAKGSG